MNGMQISTQHLQQAFAKFEVSAERVARGPADPAFVANVVDLKVSQREVEAAAKVLKLQNEVVGSLLDVIA